MKKQQPSKPKGPWLKNDDLRHDLAIEVAVMDLVTGRLTNVKFPAEDILESHQRIGGGIIVDPRLTSLLYESYKGFELINRKPPPFISGGHAFPFMVFVPITGSTHSWIGEIMSPRPVKILVFFAVKRKFTIGGSRRGNNKK